MDECRTIQRRLPSTRSPKQQFALERSFNNFMLQGRIRDAIRLLSEGNSGGPMDLDAPAVADDPSSGSVLDHLLLKHPPPQPADSSAIKLSSTPSQDHSPHFVTYEGINGDLIKSVALRTFGSAGPSGLDASAWRRLCSSFGSYSSDLCSSMAAVARRLCQSYVDPTGLRALLSCRLIALNKNPGVRPIAIGETCRRIMSKAVAAVLRTDVLEVVGSDQLCAGQKGGCEAAVHALRQAFQSSSANAILLVDAKNAFNSVNRQVALRNILHLCPSIARFLINTYRDGIDLFIGGQVMTSNKGTAQGDPLGMIMYALATMPLIQSAGNFGEYNPAVTTNTVVTLIEPLVIHANTTTNQVFRGFTNETVFNFICNASGSQLSLVWYKNGKQIAVNGPIMAISNPVPQDSGVYQCFWTSEHRSSQIFDSVSWALVVRDRVPPNVVSTTTSEPLVQMMPLQ